VRKILCLAGIITGVYFYTKLTNEKKRFIKEILRQVPYLIPRYFA